MTHIPLADQIIQIEKMLRDDARRFQLKVDRGDWKQETADRKLAALRAVQSTLTWLDQNYDWIRPEAKRRWEEARAKAELEAELHELDEDPAIAAALETFPGAEVTAIRDLSTDPDNRAAQRSGEQGDPGLSPAPAELPERSSDQQRERKQEQAA